MPSRHAAGYEFDAMVLRVAFCDRIDRKRAGTGVVVRISVPPSATPFRPAGLPMSGAPANRTLSSSIGGRVSERRGGRGTASRLSLPRARHSRVRYHLELPVDVRRVRPAGSQWRLRGTLL